MRRVLVDGSVFAFSNGGVRRYNAEVLRVLNGMAGAFSCRVLLPSNAKTRPDSGRVVRCMRPPLHQMPRYWPVLRPDVYHTPYYRQSPTLSCPHIATVYDCIDLRHPALSPNPGSFSDQKIDCLRKASAVIAISHTTRDDVIQFAGLDAERVHLAHPGLSAAFTETTRVQARERPLDMPGFTVRKPFLLHVGRRGNYKNFDRIFRAFLSTASQGTHDLVLVGGEANLEPNQERSLIDGKLTDRVHLIRTATDVQLAGLYARASALVSASIWEGFGLPLVEALSMGCPLLVSDIPAHREAAGPYATYIDPYSQDEWTRTLASPPPSSPADTSGLAQWLQAFSWSRAAQVHAHLYVNL